MTYLRFGIRDLLWAMVVVGLGLALIAEKRRLSDARERADHLRYALTFAGNLLQRETGWKLVVDESKREYGAEPPHSSQED
jgi:hypothetical protein